MGTKEPRELCAPAGCGFKEGREECFEKVQTVVQDAPKEQCTLEPQRTCKHVTKLVPKQVCTRSRTNPRKVKKPVVKKWCYVPSEESGLAKTPSQDNNMSLSLHCHLKVFSSSTFLYHSEHPF